MTKKQSANDKEAVRIQLDDALVHAKEAGLAAIKEFVNHSTLSSDGHVPDACGWAFVEVWTPTYHFREALKAIKPRSHGFNGKWTVFGFGREIGAAAHQSITAHEKGCQAACAVLQHYFPDQEFVVSSHFD